MGFDSRVGPFEHCDHELTTSTVMFLRSCVAQVLGCGDGLRHLFHSSAQYPEYNFKLVGVIINMFDVGLGTSTSKEAKSYFADMKRHRVRFQYSGADDDGCIDMVQNVFSMIFKQIAVLLSSLFMLVA